MTETKKSKIYSDETERGNVLSQSVRLKLSWQNTGKKITSPDLLSYTYSVEYLIIRLVL